MVGGCAKKLRAFVRRQSDTIVTGTRNEVRRSSLADSADEEDYVPKNFFDKVRVRVVRRLLPKGKKTNSDEPVKTTKQNGTAAEKKLSLRSVKKLISWRKPDVEAEYDDGTITQAEQKDAVAMNFESSAGLDSIGGLQSDVLETINDDCEANAQAPAAHSG